MEDLRYPTGKFHWPQSVSPGELSSMIAAIAVVPAQARDAVAGLNAAQLDTPYRDGGWTPRQMIHHVADSHINSYIRFRFALTEDAPTIKPYAEDRWAELADAKAGPVETSLAILDGLHARWTTLLRSFGEAEWARTFVHPENGVMRLDLAVALYAWHGNHHITQIRRLRERMNW